MKIANLNTEIDETNQKLEDSKAMHLLGRLLRLQDEKAELVKQMNDLEFLSAQGRASNPTSPWPSAWTGCGVVFTPSAKPWPETSCLACREIHEEPVSARPQNKNVSVELRQRWSVISMAK